MNERRDFSRPGFDNMREHRSPAEECHIKLFVCSTQTQGALVDLHAYAWIVFVLKLNFDIVGNDCYSILGIQLMIIFIIHHYADSFLD